MVWRELKENIKADGVDVQVNVDLLIKIGKIEYGFLF